jgi:FAD/FMN-containing dehydrogenase
MRSTTCAPWSADGFCSPETTVSTRPGAPGNSLQIDPAARRARVGAGASSGSLQAAAAPYDPTGLPGSSPVVSVTGVALGGGLRWFGRKYGWVADSVTAFDIVDAKGGSGASPPAPTPICSGPCAVVAAPSRSSPPWSPPSTARRTCTAAGYCGPPNTPRT